MSRRRSVAPPAHLLLIGVVIATLIGPVLITVNAGEVEREPLIMFGCPYYDWLHADPNGYDFKYYPLPAAIYGYTVIVEERQPANKAWRFIDDWVEGRKHVTALLLNFHPYWPKHIRIKVCGVYN